ncbi:MAG: TolC family protein [Chitinophagaceae bacterium]|nr:TolC family protein [Chitinophagaceae bacterium]MCB9047132.1 TolC family protein [Chitinophagales bacterium]
MRNRKINGFIGVACMSLSLAACSLPTQINKDPEKNIPGAYSLGNADTSTTAAIKWKDFFTDQYLVDLVDTALQNNQELNITWQEIQIARNEVRARKGEYLPFVNFQGGAGVDKAARYTSKGSSEATTEIAPGKETPDPLQDYMFGLYANWEVDIWKKLRNAKKAAASRYLATIEGKNFVVTNLVAEVANSYYELLALDNQLAIVRRNIDIQNDAFEIVKLQKQAARVTELAVRRFEAQVLNTRSLQYAIQQRITETENRINFLLGRYPQHIKRSTATFVEMQPALVAAGIPSQLLENRPDVRQAEKDLVAAKLDVKVARAKFYPSLGISAGVGYRAFDPSYLIKSPESLLYSLAGDLAAPLINRNAIKAAYYTANSKQIQAVYNYERTLINAYVEVANQLANINNLEQSYSLKSKQVQALSESVDIANNLFKSARADYMEVLLTQRDALEAKFELVETRRQQMNAMVNVYHALGGGWK